MGKRQVMLLSGIVMSVELGRNNKINKINNHKY